MMSVPVLCNSLTRRYLRSCRNKEERLHSKIRLHIINVQSHDDVSWQVKIGLHQYLNLVKISIKQLTTAILEKSGEFFVFQQDIAQAHRSA